jgi:hypothetical protein
MKWSSIIWDIKPRSPLTINGHIGGTWRLHLQGRRISERRKQREETGRNYYLLFITTAARVLWLIVNVFIIVVLSALANNRNGTVQTTQRIPWEGPTYVKDIIIEQIMEFVFACMVCRCRVRQLWRPKAFHITFSTLNLSRRRQLACGLLFRPVACSTNRGE